MCSRKPSCPTWTRSWRRRASSRPTEGASMASIKMPQLGESITEGTISKWLKKPGDPVKKYESLVEVITDKVNAEVPSPLNGVLKEITVQEGATVSVGTEICVMEESVPATVSSASKQSPPSREPLSSGSRRSEERRV